MGLMAAELLAREVPSLGGGVFFVFQPAEELLTGAAAMLQDGALEGVQPDAGLAVHLMNRLPIGTVGIRSGAVMTSADRLQVTVTGRGGHGATPHLAIDPVVTAAHIITAVQTLVSRETPPLKTAVLSLTTLKAGTAFNIIPDTVEMTGTFRSYETDLRETLLASLRRTVEGVASALRCTAHVRTDWLTPAVINDPSITALARQSALRIVGENRVVETEPFTGSDDLAYFWQQTPGCYAFIGSARTDGSPVPEHHNARFDIDESALEIGTEFLLQSARRILGAG